MSELRDLYQEVIVDHSKNPRNFRALTAGVRVEGYNPLCGDQLTLFVKMNGNLIEDIAFQGNGCAISKASASLLTQALKGKTTQEAETLFAAMHRLLTVGPKDIDVESLGKLAALSGVWEFPARVKCASLSWHTLKNALEGKANPVSTES